MLPFDPQKNILALDFDGVIADSIHECLFAGYNAYAGLYSMPLVHSLGEIDEDNMHEARRLRNFIRSGEDYVYIQQIIHEKIMVFDQAMWDTFVAEHADKHDEYLQAFYSVREKMSKENPVLWASLSPLFPGVKDVLASFIPQKNLYIITTKRVDYVDLILDANGIQLVQENKIQSVPGKSKLQILQSIITEQSLNPQQIIFIDDQVDTLIKTLPSGVNCLLALWGYNNADQVLRGKQAGIGTLELGEFVEIFG